jgi:hypothetical protein
MLFNGANFCTSKQQTDCQYNAHQTNLDTQIEFSVKSRKQCTSTLSLVHNRMRFQKNLQRKSTLAFSRGVSNSEMHHFLCQTWVSSGFDPHLSFFMSASSAATYIFFHCSYMYNYYNYLEPCSELNAEFQHFIPRLNKTSVLCVPHSKRDRGEKRPKDRVKTEWL